MPVELAALRSEYEQKCKNFVAWLLEQVQLEDDRTLLQNVSSGDIQMSVEMFVMINYDMLKQWQDAQIKQPSSDAECRKWAEGELAKIDSPFVGMILPYLAKADQPRTLKMVRYLVNFCEAVATLTTASDELSNS
jgi:hypothetical protein